MLKFCEELDATLVADRPCGVSAPTVASHLFEAMGQMVYDPAEGLLRGTFLSRNRGCCLHAAVSDYCMGWLKAGSGDEELCQLFYQRLMVVVPDF